MLPTIVVAGASGFIGKALGPALGDRYRLVGLSRRERQPTAGYSSFRKADLFSLRDTEKALEGADFVIYLVHSMMPSARLVQGHFGDLDLLCADNVARAAALHGVKQIVYVGGIVPTDSELSDHLRSRLEVETALGSRGVPLSTLRAGLVVGGGGSSFQMLHRLVKRLPVMLCPSWTRTRMVPVDLRVVLEAIDRVVSRTPEGNRVYDLGEAPAISYQELMAATAEAMNLERRFIPIGLLTPGLSRLWVSLTTGAPRALVAPLIKSLRHEMIPRDEPRYRLEGLTHIGVEEMLANAVAEANVTQSRPRAFEAFGSSAKDTVRSVQRMHLPEGRDATWAAHEYMRWIPRALPGLLRVEMRKEIGEVKFKFSGMGPALLRLEHKIERSEESRQVFRVVDGLLAAETERGRLEFRQVLDDNTLLAAVHDFVPSLPWWVYRFSQAETHRLVMHRFARHLASQAPA